jgi:hypothetical protein
MGSLGLARGRDEGSPALLLYPHQSGVLSSGAGNLGAVFSMSHGTLVGVMLAIPLAITNTVESVVYERRVAEDRQWIRCVCVSGVLSSSVGAWCPRNGVLGVAQGACDITRVVENDA